MSLHAIVARQIEPRHADHRELAQDPFQTGATAAGVVKQSSTAGAALWQMREMPRPAEQLDAVAVILRPRLPGLADVTVVVLVPEGGDVIQTMKAGLMEIADIFVVNKSDRPDADTFVNNLKMMLAPAFKSDNTIPIIKTIASEKKGIEELKEEIIKHQDKAVGEKKYIMLAEKAWQLIQNKRMKNVSKLQLKEEIESESVNEGFNLYKYIRQHF